MREAFAKMKNDALFVNTARESMCNYVDLYYALVDGEISRVMMETFGVEPVPADWPLLRPPKVTLTPHITGASVRTVALVAEEVRRYIADEPPRNPC